MLRLAASLTVAVLLIVEAAATIGRHSACVAHGCRYQAPLPTASIGGNDVNQHTPYKTSLWSTQLNFLAGPISEAIYSSVNFPDVSGDGSSDFCFWNSTGTYCAIAQQASFAGYQPNVFGGAKLWSSAYTSTGPQDNWATLRFPDINGDGKADICVRRSFGISCAVSNGTAFVGATLRTASFSDSHGWTLGPGGWVTIQYADVNGDGRDDVCGRNSSGVWCAVANPSAAAFNPTSLWSFSLSHSSFDTASAISFPDVNGDGMADVCARNGTGVYCARSNGLAHFVSFSRWSSGFINAWSDLKYLSTIRFADINGDGRADICGRASAGVICGISTGSNFTQSGTPQTPFLDSNGYGVQNRYGTFQLVDVNADGRADACMRGPNGVYCSLSITTRYDPGQTVSYLGNVATFTPTIRLTANFGDDASWNSSAAYWATVKPATTLAGSGYIGFCGRGAFGIICTNGPAVAYCKAPDACDSTCVHTPRACSGSVCRYQVPLPQPQKTGAFVRQTATLYSAELSDSEGPVSADEYGTLRFPDLDCDGSSDVCYRNSSGLFCALASQESYVKDKAGSFGRFALWSSSFGASWTAGGSAAWRTIQFPDLNGDGKADVCGRGPAGLPGINCALSYGTYFGAVSQWSPGFWLGWQLEKYYASIQFADVNGDGRDDVCGRGASGIFCALSLSSNRFSAVRQWSLNFADDIWGVSEAYYGTVSYPDVNGDGMSDVCGRYSSGVWCALSTGEQFTAIRQWDTTLTDSNGWGAKPQYRSLRWGDLNGDGRSDVCGVHPSAGWVCRVSNGTHLLPGFVALGGGNFSSAALAPQGRYTSLALIDIDRDGRADVCARGPGGIACAISVVPRVAPWGPVPPPSGNAFSLPQLLVPAFNDTAAGPGANASYWTTVQPVGSRLRSGYVGFCGRTPAGISCSSPANAPPCSLCDVCTLGSVSTCMAVRPRPPAVGARGAYTLPLPTVNASPLPVGTAGVSLWSPLAKDNPGAPSARLYRSIRFPDLNCDGTSDVCFLENAGGVRCAVALQQPHASYQSRRFRQGKLWTSATFGPTLPAAAESVWATVQYPDLNGDGKPDVCGRTPGGIECAVNNGSAFAPAKKWLASAFNSTWLDGAVEQQKVWSTIRFPDVNGDGKADVCGRGPSGLWCGLSSGTAFQPATLWIAGFASGVFDSQASSWQTLAFPDLNADGKADVCARSTFGMQCALSNGAGLFTDSTLWTNVFSDANGWSSVKYYPSLRFGDVNRDGRADVCGRGEFGVTCLLSDGTKFVPLLGGGAQITSFADLGGYNDLDKTSSMQVVDVDGDGKADVCIRGAYGILCAQSKTPKPANLLVPVSGVPAFDGVFVLVSGFMDGMAPSSATMWQSSAHWVTVQPVTVRLGSGYVGFCGRSKEGIQCSDGPSAAVCRPGEPCHTGTCPA